MSDSDFDVVRRYCDAWNEGEIDRMLTLIDPAVEWQPGTQSPFPGKHVGREGLERFLRSWAASFDRLHVQVGEPRAVRGWFVAEMRQRGRPRGGSVEIDTTLTHAWRVEDGRINGWMSFADEDDALATLEPAGSASADDVDTLRRGYEAWNRGEVETVLELVDPEIEWQPGEDAPETGASRGREAFKGFITSWSESFDEFRLVPEEMTVVGDRVIVALRQSGRGRGSGIELDIRTVHVWTIRHGRAVAWSAYRNRDQALAANGVSDHVCKVVRGYAAFNRGDVEASLEILDPEIEWHTYIVPGPGGGVYHGHDGVRELWSDAQRIFGGFRNVPERLFEAGDHVVAFVRVEGVGTKSGIAVQARIAHLHTFQGDRVIRVESFEDQHDALRLAGIEDGSV